LTEEETIKKEKEKAKVTVIAKWKVDFEMEETLSTTTEEADTLTQHQREITHAIARGISAIVTTDKHLKIVDYRILKNGREQPEADALYIKWGRAPP